MVIRTLILLLCAAVAGFLGSRANSQFRGETANAIRTSKIELVNPDGIVVGLWEASGRGSVMKFVSARGKSLLEIGENIDGMPELRMDGRDGKQRVLLTLNLADRPSMALSDEQWQGRVSLGFLEADVPDPRDDNWGLLFRSFGSERPVAGIGTSKSKTGKPEGFLTISGKPVH
ncbi:MAG: hypothetical protein KGN84_04715 [Acidobacteriota bacterium]|nr:hypothetical protein [Acidobacteriota bacterium]